MSLVNEIEVIELQELLDNPQMQLDIFDVRSSLEVSNGTIPQSKHLPLHIIPSKLIELTDKNPIILFCHMGARSIQACRYLQNAGFDNVYTLRGGFKAWKESGLAD